MKKYVKFINCVILLLAVLSTLGSCSGPSLKKNKIYVTGTDVMGEPVVDKDLFKSFDHYPDSVSVDFPETKMIKLPDGTEAEGKKQSQSKFGGKYGLPYATYHILSPDLFVDVSEDGTVLEIFKISDWAELNYNESVLSDDEAINKAKELYRLYYCKDVPADCETSISWDNTENGRQKGRANVSFTKKSEGYRWASGIIIGMNAYGEMIRVSDKMQLLSGKQIPSGFAEGIEEEVEKWVKDKTTVYTLYPGTLLLSGDGKLLARAVIKITPEDREPYGVKIIIPLE